MSRVDRAFARFRSSGDARALGVVFDATAEDLFRFAWHLTGDRHAAEDLVQTTFLTAIEDAASFDEAQRVVPWLVGILANRAREARRARARTAPAGAIAPEKLIDPVEEAAAHELGDTVRDGLRALDEPYRDVLVLHLEQGLGAKEIAERLGRPAGTVRSQILRGLDRLRRALPASLAAGARACAPLPVLGEVRAAVLAHAGRGLPVATAAPAALTIGALLMKKSVLTAAVVVLAGLLAWPLWSPLLQNAPADPPAKSEAPAAREVAAAAAAAEAAPAPVAPAAERVEAPATPPPALTVHVRFAADGTPGANVEVTARPWTLDGKLLELRARSDATGTARFERVTPGPVAVRADRGGRPQQVEVVAGVPSTVEILIQAGVTLGGRVVDARSGTGIAGASVWLSTSGGSVNEGSVAGHTDSEGRFTLRDVAPGLLVGAWADGFGPSQVEDVPSASTDLTLRLWSAPGIIEGFVLGPDGTPIEGASILVGFAGAPGLTRMGNRPLGSPPRFLRSDAQGRFRAASTGVTTTPVWVRAPACCLWLKQVDVRADGVTRLEVHLQRGTTVTGRVVTANGEPVAQASVRASHPDVEPKRGMAWQGPSWGQFLAFTDATGRYELRGIPSGEIELQAIKDKVIASAKLRLGPGDHHEWNAVLGAGASIHGIVVDEGSKPLSGLEVSAEASKGGRRLGPAVTDATGSFTLGGATDDAYRVRVVARDSDMHGALAQVDDVRPGGTVLRIEVAGDCLPSARLTAVVLGPGDAPLERLTILLQRAAADGTVRIGGGQLTMSAGRFTTKPITPGRYEVLLTDASLGQLSLGVREVAAGATLDVGTLRYAECATLEVEVIGSDGKPATALLKLRRDDELMGSGLPAFGGKAVWRVQAGRYVVSTLGGVMAMGAIEITAGRTEKLRLELPKGVQRRLSFPAVPRDDYYLMQRWRDTSGRLVFEGTGTWSRSAKPTETVMTVVPGRYTVEVQDASGASKSIEVTVDERPESETVIELPLPGR